MPPSDSVQVRLAADSRETALAADILVTATPSEAPVVMRDWVRPGAHINAIGADAAGKQELDPEILKAARIVVDDWAQASHSGEINVPLSKGEITVDMIYGSLGEVVAGKKPGRQNSEEITVFDSTGLIIQDLSLGFALYNRARGAGLGGGEGVFEAYPGKDGLPALSCARGKAGRATV